MMEKKEKKIRKVTISGLRWNGRIREAKWQSRKRNEQVVRMDRVENLPILIAWWITIAWN